MSELYRVNIEDIPDQTVKLPFDVIKHNILVDYI